MDLSSLRHILVELAVGVCFDYCEYVEIGNIFISDMAFCVNIFDPVVSGMACEEDEHLYIVHSLANTLN